MHVGAAGDSQPVTIPASPLNVLIAGGSGMGKSYLAGLLAEEVSELGYSALVVDLEGDHLDLDDLRGVLSVGGVEPLPKPREIHRLLRHRFGSVVLDLSLLVPHEQDAYIWAMPEIIDEERSHAGLPHWVFVDEAHRLVGTDLTGALMLHETQPRALSGQLPSRAPRRRVTRDPRRRPPDASLVAGAGLTAYGIGRWPLALPVEGTQTMAQPCTSTRPPRDESCHAAWTRAQCRPGR